MSSSGRFAINSLWAFQVTALLALSLILLVFEGGLYPLLLLPGFVFGAALLIFVPQSVLYIFFCSLFWGRSLFEKSYVAVTLTDVVITLLTLAYLGWRLRNPAGGGDFKLHKAIWVPLVGFFLWAIVSFVSNFHSYDTEFVLVTLWYLSRLLQLMVLFLIFSDSRLSISLPLVINLFLVVYVLQFPLALAQYALAANLAFEQRRMAVCGTLSYHHTMLATSLLIPLALCLARFLEASHRKAKFLYAGVGLILLMTIFVTAARSPLIGIAVAGVVFLLMKFRLRWKHFVYLGLGLGGLALMVAFSPLQRVIAMTFSSSEYGGALDVSSMSRFLIWKGAITHFFEAGMWTKLVGVGVGAYPTIKYDFVLWSSQKLASGAHNNLLHVLTEVGVGGLLLFLALFGGILYTLARRMRTDKLSLAFFFLTVALLGSCLTQETFWFQRSLATLWIMYMTLLALVLRRPATPELSAATGTDSAQPPIYINTINTQTTLPATAAGN